MILGDRDQFVGFHMTPEGKTALLEEAKRRRLSMSALINEVLEDWLKTASQETLQPIRSNKRIPKEGAIKEEDVPLPLEVE